MKSKQKPNTIYTHKQETPVSVLIYVVTNAVIGQQGKGFERGVQNGFLGDDDDSDDDDDDDDDEGRGVEAEL